MRSNSDPPGMNSEMMQYFSSGVADHSGEDAPMNETTCGWRKVERSVSSFPKAARSRHASGESP